jgi:hypothetical protein
MNGRDDKVGQQAEKQNVESIFKIRHTEHLCHLVPDSNHISEDKNGDYYNQQRNYGYKELLHAANINFYSETANILGNKLRRLLNKGYKTVSYI